MSLLNSLIGMATGNSGGNNDNPLLNALGGLLEQNGGLQGLLGKFNQAGLGDAVNSWVGMAENHQISPEQIQQVLGSEQVQAIASKLGVDPAMASSFLAQHLPNIVDKLTPTGQVDPNADHQQGLAALLPALMQSMVNKTA